MFLQRPLHNRPLQLAAIGVTWTAGIVLAVPLCFTATARPIPETSLTDICNKPMPLMCDVLDDWSTVMPLLTRRSYTLATTTLQFCLPLGALIFVNVYIGRLHHLSSQLLSSIGRQVRQHAVSRVALTVCPQQQMRMRHQARSSLALLAALVGTFIVCWMPHHVYFILRSFDKIDGDVTVLVRIVLVLSQIVTSLFRRSPVCAARSAASAIHSYTVSSTRTCVPALFPDYDVTSACGWCQWRVIVQSRIFSGRL